MKTVLLSLILFTLQMSSAHGLSCKRYLRKAINAENRARLTKEYSGLVFKSPEENRAWIKKAFDEKAEGLYVEFTASMLKELNDSVIKDIDLVTALVNLHKKMVFDSISKLLSSQGLESVSYSDFKTGRFYIDATSNRHDEISNSIEQAFLKADQNFKTKLINDGLVRSSDLKAQWFHLGISNSPDLASVAARKAKDKGQTTDRILNAQDLEALEQDRKGITNIFRNLQNSSDFSFAFEKNGRLKLKLVEVYRKNKSPKALASALKDNMGAQISLSSAAKIIKLLKDADVLSPSLIVEERTSVAVEETPFGAFSLDFVGLGAKNLRSTLEGVVESLDASDMIFQIRAKEREVTEDFADQKMKIFELVDTYFKTEKEESFVKRTDKEAEPYISFSGDEGIIVPFREVTTRDQLELQKRLFNLFGYAQLRMTFVKADSEGQLQTNLVSAGENLEKALKKKLLKKISGEVLGQIQFNIFIPDAESQIKTAYLYLYMQKALSGDQKIFLKKTFLEVVDEMNASRKDGESEFIASPDVFAIVGN